MVLDTDLLQELDAALERRDVDRVREMLFFDGDTELRAEAFEDLSTEQLLGIRRLLGAAVLAELLTGLGAETIAAVLGRVPVREAAIVVNEMEPDDATDVIERLAPDEADSLLVAMRPVKAAAIRELLVYPPDTAGGRMTPEFIALSPDLRADEAVVLLRRIAQEAEHLHYVYVTDEDDRLLGVVSMRNLVLSPPYTPIVELMVADTVSITADTDQEEAAHRLRRHHLLALPVLDEEGRLLGIVTADDIAEVVQEEATEDFHRTAAVAPLESRYRQTPVSALYRKRVGWLLALVLVGLSSSSVIYAFEGTLSETIALTFFIPLLIGSGGNTGAQSATLIVRALATGDLRMHEWLRAVAKELGVGASLAITMAAATALLGVARGGIEVGIIVGISMFSIVLVANLLGTLLPLVLTKAKVDPATASSPLIASMTDTLGLIIYFAVANIILNVL